MSERLTIHLKSFQVPFHRLTFTELFRIFLIMLLIINIFLKIIKAIDWNEESTKKGPNQYMEILVKETTTLHKVLNKYLPPEILQVS
jgi:hypothetical protein